MAYVRGVPVWATLLALERDGDRVCAVASAPALGRRWWAVRGGGAFADGAPIRVSGLARVEDCSVSCTSQSPMPAGWRELVARSWKDQCLGDFWQHCLVAEGAVDVSCDAEVNLWDYAAVQLIVEEAGGRCTTFAGGEPTPGGSFVASNGLVHDEVVSLLSGSTTAG